MSSLLETLEALNRKERYFLFAYATGNGDRGLTLSEGFRDKLSEAAGLPVPPHAVGFIDYHIDWIYAAVQLAREPEGPVVRANWQGGPFGPKSDPFKPWVSTGNQEDIDLLVAFERDGITTLILVEAKAETSWTNKQLWSKAERLRRIFGGEAVAAGASIQPIVCLMSPKKSAGLAPPPGKQWPEWMLLSLPNEFRWLELKVPNGRKKVTGCTEDGAASFRREYWKIESIRPQAALLE